MATQYSNVATDSIERCIALANRCSKTPLNGYVAEVTQRCVSEYSCWCLAEPFVLSACFCGNAVHCVTISAAGQRPVPGSLAMATCPSVETAKCKLEIPNHLVCLLSCPGGHAHWHTGLSLCTMWQFRLDRFAVQQSQLGHHPRAAL